MLIRRSQLITTEGCAKFEIRSACANRIIRPRSSTPWWRAARSEGSSTDPARWTTARA